MQNGTLAAHEIGHMLGVAHGKIFTSPPPYPYPPYYSFGGYTTAFPDSTEGHLMLRSYEPYGYFRGSAGSIMDSGKAGYSNTQNWNTSYTSYDKAYLRQRTFYLEDSYPHYQCADGSCVDLCPAP